MSNSPAFWIIIVCVVLIIFGIIGYCQYETYTQIMAGLNQEPTIIGFIGWIAHS